MKIHRAYIIAGLLIAFGLFFELAAHADETNQEVKMTFTAPVQIPGRELPAGTYVFPLADPDNNYNLVQVFNVDRTVLYATLETASAQRMEPSGDVAVTLAEQGSGRPDVVVNWFYPGNTIGHEFLYSTPQQKEFA